MTEERVPAPHWRLKFGASLELEAWNLELFPPVFHLWPKISRLILRLFVAINPLLSANFIYKQLFQSHL